MQECKEKPQNYNLFIENKESSGYTTPPPPKLKPRCPEILCKDNEPFR